MREIEAKARQNQREQQRPFWAGSATMVGTTTTYLMVGTTTNPSVVFGLPGKVISSDASSWR